MVTNATHNKEEKKPEVNISPADDAREPERPQIEQTPSIAPLFERKQRNKRYKNYNNIYSKKEDSKGK